MEEQRAYTTGLELKLPDTFFGPAFYWRVRGLDLKGRPVSEFSDIEETYVDIFKSVKEKPTPLSFSIKGPVSGCSIRCMIGLLSPVPSPTK